METKWHWICIPVILYNKDIVVQWMYILAHCSHSIHVRREEKFLFTHGFPKEKSSTKLSPESSALNKLNKITPSEMQDKTINLISFCKTKGHNTGFLYSHSHYSVIPMTSPMSLLSVLLLFWPQTDHTGSELRDREDQTRSENSKNRQNTRNI